MGATWSTNKHERKCITCSGCRVNVAGLTTVDHLFEGNSDLKTYIFWHDSASTENFTNSTSFGFEGGFPSMGVGNSTTVEKGMPLVKMFRKDKEKYICAECFSVYHPTLFRDVCATLCGVKHIVNVQAFTLANPEVGGLKQS